MDGRVDPARIARVANELADPDVLCLQEVAVNYPALAGSRGENQVELLQRQFPDHAAVFAAAVDVSDGAGGRRQFGNLILSRHPIVQVFRHTLPWPPEDATPSMPRIALEAVIETPSGPLRVITTHLEYYSARQRAAQVARIRELHSEACAQSRARPAAKERSGPFQRFARPPSAILTGDFNMRPEDPACAQLVSALSDGSPRFVDAWVAAHPGIAHPPSFCLADATYAKEPYCCDFAFVTEDLLPALDEVRIDADTRASDHQPVILRLR